MARNTWPSEWLRGVLSLAVLRILTDGDAYGYAIATSLEDAGFGAIKGGTLYPLLTRLETAELVETYWGAGDGGPERKYFHLTEAGRVQFLEQAALWRDFATTTTTFMNTTSEEN